MEKFSSISLRFSSGEKRRILMAAPLAIYVEIEVALCTIFAFVVMIKIYSRLRHKMNQLSKTVILMLFFWILAIFTFNGKMLIEIFEVTEGPIYLFFYTAPQHLLLIGLYYFFGFVRIVFLREGTDIGKLTKLVAILVAGSIVFAIIRDFFPSLYSPELAIVRDIFGLVATLIVVIPTLFGALRLRHILPKDNPHQSQFLHIEIMAFAFLLMATTLVIENLIWQSFGGEYPNEASFVMWVFIVIQIYAIYHGVLPRKSKISCINTSMSSPSDKKLRLAVFLRFSTRALSFKGNEKDI